MYFLYKMFYLFLILKSAHTFIYPICDRQSICLKTEKTDLVTQSSLTGSILSAYNYLIENFWLSYDDFKACFEKTEIKIKDDESSSTTLIEIFKPYREYIKGAEAYVMKLLFNVEQPKFKPKPKCSVHFAFILTALLANLVFLLKYSVSKSLYFKKRNKLHAKTTLSKKLREPQIFYNRKDSHSSSSINLLKTLSK